MSGPTHYDTLEVSRTALPSVIKAAKKALWLEFHPDKTLGLPESERAAFTEKFRAVQHAFETLGKPESRAKYDATLSSPKIPGRRDSAQNTRETHGASSRLIPLTRGSKQEMRSKASSQLKKLEQELVQRDQVETSLSDEAIWYTMDIWTEMADENMENGNTYLFDYCRKEVSLYQRKLVERRKTKEKGKGKAEPAPQEMRETSRPHPNPWGNAYIPRPTPQKTPRQPPRPKPKPAEQARPSPQPYPQTRLQSSRPQPAPAPEPRTSVPKCSTRANEARRKVAEERRANAEEASRKRQEELQKKRGAGEATRKEREEKKKMRKAEMARSREETQRKEAERRARRAQSSADARPKPGSSRPAAEPTAESSTYQ